MTKDFYKALAIIILIVLLFSSGIFTYYAKRDLRVMNEYKNISLELPMRKVDKEHRVNNTKFESAHKRTE